MASICSANAWFSTATSSSQFPSQLAGFRFVEPTRAHRPSATAVLACSMDPFHSNTRTPASRSGRYPARDSARNPGTSLAVGTSSRTSTPSLAAAHIACTYDVTATKYASVSHNERRAAAATI